MNPPTTVGRHPLTSRFTAITRVAYVTYAPREQLRDVYHSMLAAVFKRGKAPSPWNSETQVKNLSEVMLEVYDQVCSSFSVDDHRHYRFTPRNLSNWVLSLQRYDLQECELLDAVAYEGARVFRDRLVGSDAQNQFDVAVAGAIRGTFSHNVNMDALYTTFAAVEDKPAPGSAMPLAGMAMDRFKSFVEERLQAYEREIKELDILLFPEVLERIARFDRALSVPGGSMLLCGCAGVGRRTTVTLVSYMHRLEMFTPAMGRGYDLKSFRNDLKRLMQETGVENKRMLLMLEDHQVEDKAFLEIVNSLLASGEVPGLYTNLELDSMLAPLREEFAKDGNAKTLFDFFTSRVKRNLSIVLSLDPSNEEFAFRCESNPAFFTRCTIQWMESWSQEGMQEVPNMLLQEVFNMSDDDYDDNIVDQMMYVHSTCNATPREYVNFVGLYKQIFAAKRTQQLEQKQFLQGGLSKLAEAAAKVDELSQQAGSQKKLLDEKQIQAEQALGQITTSMQRASESKTEVEKQQKKISTEEVELNMRRKGIEEELSEIQPLIDSARKAVGQIKSDNLNEIRALKSPPDAIRDVLEGVLRLMGQGDTSWQSMKKFLASRAVKDEIINFDARRVTPANRKSVQDLINSKASSFEHQNIYRVSVAAAPLAAWVKANVKFSMVLERIAPLERDLEDLNASLEESKQKLQQCEVDLKHLDQEVMKLKTEFAKRTSEAEELKIGLKKATDQLEAAEGLLGKLGGEKERWQEQVNSLEHELKALPLNTVASAGFITYLPNLSERQREEMLGKWCAYMQCERFDLKRFMSTESEMLTWKANGLPGDDLSMENAVVLLNSKRQCPLIIDPGTQASSWLKKELSGDKPVETLTTHDARFTTQLELAVRFGKVLVVEEVDRIEPLMYPLLRRDLTRQGMRLMVQVGDKVVDYNESFRLFLVTRNPYPVIPPDASPLIAQVNFSVTRGGLQGQLLGLTMQHEKPEIEEQKSFLLKQEEDLKVQLAGLEKTLLETLAKSTGNILENTALIRSLDETKAKSTTIQTSLTESHALQASLDEQRDVYRPFAERASIMFFLMRDLRTLNTMYQFSLSVFTQLFKQALGENDHANLNVTSRITSLTSSLLQLVFSYVSRSLYKKDRLTFAMHFARELAQELIPEEAWALFTGSLVADGGGAQRPAWVGEEHAAAWAKLTKAMPTMAQNLDLGNAAAWSTWMRSSQCEQEFPEQAQGRDKAFTQVLLTQALRPDRLESAMQGFVCLALGLKAISPPPLSLQRIHSEELTAKMPMLLITTPGADPSQELEEFAARTVGAGKYHQLAMGQGQSEEALRLLKACARNGEWLCLQNLHLVVTWLTSLEKELYTLDAHPSFRLFLTSEPHPKFPATLLEGSLKVTFEAPPGIKKNLQRTYDSWTPQYVAQGSPLRAQLLFALAWFHAVVQERRSYVPQGWSKFYEFSFADLRSGADIIDLSTKGGRTPQWAYIHGLLENAIYGGRVDNSYDVQTLRCYLQQLFSDQTIGANGVRPVALAGSKIVIPSNSNHADYSSLLNTLGDADDAALFGLPANVDRATQQIRSAEVISNLKAMAASSVASSRFDRELWAQRLKPLLTAWDHLVAKAGSGARDMVTEDDIARVRASPVDSFVGMQVLFARRLVGLLQKSLGGLGRVLKGAEMLSPAAVATGQALLANQLPAAWDALWEGPEDPVQYITAAMGIVSAVDKSWQLVGQGGLLSQPINLSHFFQPQVFLNALRQQTARSLGVSMDSLKLVTSWDQGALKDGVAVTGLQLQGAIFDGRRLSEVPADGQTALALPPAKFAWIPKEAAAPYANALPVPLYRTAERAAVIAEIQLPLGSAAEAPQWVLSGTACFLAG